MCNSKKNEFIKKQDPEGLWSSLGLQTRLSKVLMLKYNLINLISLNIIISKNCCDHDFFIWVFRLLLEVILLNDKYQQYINKDFFSGDNIMTKMHLRQPRYSFSLCGPLTKNKERIQKTKKTGDSRLVILD